MYYRIGITGAALLVLGAFGLASPPDRPAPDKDKNAIKLLFDGLPADLRTKVRDNPVRCDRVNDWLQDNVNGKGRTVEIRVDVKEVLPYRRNTGYLVHFFLEETKVNLLDADWQVVLADVGNGPAVGRKASGAKNFSFEGISTVDAERLVDLKRAVVVGKVKEAKISRLHASSVATSAPTVTIILEDVLVDGKKWTPYQTPAGDGFGPGAPFGVGGAKGKGKKTPP